MKDWSIIPKSVSKERIERTFAIDGVSLKEDEMEKIDSMPERFKVCGDGWLSVKVFFGDDE